MKAIVHTRYGPPSVLHLDEVPRPTPGRGQVLVKVRAAAVDPGLGHVTTGRPYLIRATPFGLRGGRARVRGLDLTGVVEAVGPKVTRFRPGDEVFGVGDGSYAEYACAEQDRLAHKPAGLDFHQAAAMPVSGCTALQALRDHGRLRAGQRVLVIGAAGGVGTFAVQLAKAVGAHVTGVCATDATDLVRSLGAEETIDYTREDPLAGTRRHDLILDLAGDRPLGRLRRALTPRGTLVIVGGEGIGRQLRATALSPFLRQRLRTFVATQPHRDLQRLAELADQGALTPVIAGSHPLAEVPAALTRLLEGGVQGKLAITVPG